MPKYIQFEDDAVFPNIGKPLQVSGFYLTNEPSDVPFQEPFAWDPSLVPFSGESGISYFARAASGEFFSQSPTVGWSLVDPITEKSLSRQDMQHSRVFQGFDISILDETGLLVKKINTRYDSNYVELNTSHLVNIFSSVKGDPAFTTAHGVGKDPRKMRLKVVANDYYGHQHTGEYYLTSPEPRITGVDVDIGTSLNFTPYITKSTGLVGIGFYASAISGFDEAVTGSGVALYDYEMFSPVSEDGNYEVNPPTLESGFFYKLVPFDNFGAGSGFLYPSSIKPFDIDPLAYSQVPSGMTGKLAVSQTYFDKITRPQLMLKWNRELGGRVTYEAKVEESGKFYQSCTNAFNNESLYSGGF